MTGSLDVVGGTIFRNTASAPMTGGGIASEADTTVRILDSTIAANVDPGGGANVWSAGTTDIRSSTVVDGMPVDGTSNQAAGTQVQAVAGRFTIGASILRANPRFSAGPMCGGAVVSTGYDLIQDASCGPAATGDLLNTTAQLEDFQDYGGPTPTEPLANAVGIDAIPADSPFCGAGALPLDQRGQPRRPGPACDIGAVERNVVIEARTFVVDSAGDGADGSSTDGRCAAADGTCTLRAAVQEANAVHGLDTITIEPGIDPVFGAAGGLFLQDSAIIHGNGATIHANGVQPAIYVLSEVSTATWTIDDLTVTGAGIPTASGGGIYLNAVGELTVVDSTFSDNQAFMGAAIMQVDGRPVVERSTFADNVASPNVAFGGAVAQSGGAADVRNSTFTGNRAVAVAPGQVSSGSAVSSAFGAGITVSDSTFVENPSTGGVIGTPGGHITVVRSVFAEPTTCGSPINLAGESYNLTLDASCPFQNTGDRQVPSLELGPFGAHGGPTRTFVPDASSPALDVYPPGGGECGVTVDQRGEHRPSGAGCDVGSVERQPTDP